MSKELFLHPVKKKIKLNHHNAKVKLLNFESERKETTIRCYEDNTLFKNPEERVKNLLRKTQGDNDADTTESEKQRAQQLCYMNLIEAVKKNKIRNKNFSSFFDTISQNSQKIDQKTNKKLSSSVKSRKFENQQEFDIKKKYIKNEEKS